MAKSPDAFRTISEVADWLGVEAHVLRFWETKFAQVKPVKRAGGRRYYRPSDMALLGGIRRLLHDEGVTIRGVQKILREKGASHVSGLSPELRLAEVESAAPSRARGAPQLEEAVETATPVAGAAPPAEEDAPTLPFDLPPTSAPDEVVAPTDAMTVPGSAQDGDGRVHATPSPPENSRAGDAASVPLRVPSRALQLDQAAAAEVLARARALVERLRNSPE